MEPEKTYTLEQFIESGNRELINYNKFSIFELHDGIKIQTYNLIDDYIDELKSMALLYTLNENEITKYKYKPKLLSYDLYLTTELDYIILKINNMVSCKEFELNNGKLYLIDKDTLSSALSQIYNSEYDIIMSNKNKMELK